MEMRDHLQWVESIDRQFAAAQDVDLDELSRWLRTREETVGLIAKAVVILGRDSETLREYTALLEATCSTGRVLLDRVTAIRERLAQHWSALNQQEYLLTSLAQAPQFPSSSFDYTG